MELFRWRHRKSISGDGSITDFTAAAAGATSGIGILKRTGTAVLKAEIQALETLGLGKTISNPKVFTMDNQIATIKQGEEIQFQSTGLKVQTYNLNLLF